MKNIFNIKSKWIALGLASVTILSSLSLTSCKESIDESDLYTFTGEMMVDHFENNPEQFSSYLTLLSRVKPSKRSKSTMRDLLDARGHYTCFAPTNEAIQMYLDSLKNMDEPMVDTTDPAYIPDSVAETIVFNSIIQNGDEDAYKSTSFESGALNTTNMNDRYIDISFGTRIAGISEANDTAYATVTYVNTYSAIIEPDIEVENGYIHAIDHVLSPSNATIAGMILNTPNTQMFGEMLELTGFDLKMGKIKDEAWEEKYYDIKGTNVSCGTGDFDACHYPEKRSFGFTVFVETDDVFKKNGINNLDDLKSYVKANANYDDDTSRGHETSWGDDYTNDYNWLNQFISYHILPENLKYNNLVTFANEYGCETSKMKDRSQNSFYVNVWEYWETLGVQRRSLKITGIRGTKKINRISKYNLANYKEILSEIVDTGLTVMPTNEEYNNNAVNGFYYPISDILIWNSKVPNKVLNERMRYDVTSLFPEFLTNGIRQGRSQKAWITTPDYLDNVSNMSEETKFIYLTNKNYSGAIGSWMNYQADEFNIQGIFDFTLKLPPVPYTGTYEIRYGINANNNRGMAQVYLGKNKNNLPAVGIPLDLRSASGTNINATGWIEDGRDANTNAENDKSMRNLGFMKGPKYIQLANGKTGRDGDQCLRKIIYTGVLEAGETYYVRFKSVLQGDKFEFFFDYLEFVPKSIYAGDIAEDVW